MYSQMITSLGLFCDNDKLTVNCVITYMNNWIQTILNMADVVFFFFSHSKKKKKKREANFHSSHISSRCTRMQGMYLRSEHILLKEITVESFS